MRALPLTEVLPSHEVMVANIVSVWNESTDDDRANGCVWYELAHLYAHSLGRGNTAKGAGVIAALSPQTSWQENIKLAVRAFSTRGPSGQTRANVDKAKRILQGDDVLSTLGANHHRSHTYGRKVRSFYALMLDPTNAEDVCVDRHALSIALADPYASAKVLERVGAYDALTAAYREAAQRLECLPWQVQAVTWLAWRKRKRSNESSFTNFEIDHAAIARDLEAHPEDYF